MRGGKEEKEVAINESQRKGEIVTVIVSPINPVQNIPISKTFTYGQFIG